MTALASAYAAPRSVERDWDAIERSIAEHASRLTEAQRAELEEILELDLTSEYDARLFSAYVRGLGLPYTEAFLEMERQWAVDEARHCDTFRRALQAGFGWTDERIARLSERRPDFGPIEHLFREEFSILCLGVYDELATVRAYRANLAKYAWLGPEFLAVLEDVIADEGWHSSRFLKVIRDEHGHRLGEADRIVAEIRAVEGTPYGNTFVLDHDDSVWSDEIFEEAAELLERRLKSSASA